MTHAPRDEDLSKMLDVLAELRDQVASLTELLTESRRDSVDKADAIAAYQAQINDLSRRLGGSVALATRERRRADALEKQLDAIHRSRSWRIVSLIQRVVWALRGLIPGGRRRGD